MTIIFDDAGHATEAGNVRVFHYVTETGEYWTWSDEFIPVGVSIPGNSTLIDPGEDIAGHVWVFDGKTWLSKADHRGETTYSTETGAEVIVKYIGEIKDGFTTTAPVTAYDKWDGVQWVTDASAQHAADVVSAEAQKRQRIDQANAYMNSKQWPGKAAMGRLTDSEKAQYNAWLDYLDALEAVDTTSAPDINWPVPPVA